METMFVALAVACGLIEGDPLLNKGCGIIFQRRLVSTEEECIKDAALMVAVMPPPAGAYITDVQCVPVKVDPRKNKT